MTATPITADLDVEADLAPSEPVTVIVSDKGWVRAAKGHDIDATALSYREGDRYLASARGRSNLQAAFLDSTAVFSTQSLLGNVSQQRKPTAS